MEDKRSRCLLSIWPPLSPHKTTPSVSSLTPEQIQLKRVGFAQAKDRLYQLLTEAGAPFEVITGAPLLPGQQEAAHMVPSSADDSTLLLLEYAFSLEPRTFAVHSKWNLAPMNQLYHRTIDRHGGFLLPSLESITYMQEKLNLIAAFRVEVALVEPDERPFASLYPHLTWQNIRRCDHEDTYLHTYSFIPFGFVFPHSQPDPHRPPPPICQWSAQTGSYIQYPYPYAQMPDIHSHLSPFLVLANCFEKYTRWQQKLSNLPRPPEGPSPYSHFPNPVLLRLAPFLESPERITRYEKLIGLFTQLRVMDTERRMHEQLPPQEPDVFMSSPSSSSVFTSPHPSASQPYLPSVSPSQPEQKFSADRLLG
ncbi:hypothetical protein D9757_013922 [Collybiopsis confluens]|uniref:Uncharacterized protein n=1 Tax=Collybiopsis confluens TaxID=2823264 RepID=A0A8H5CMG2_9AGAR|nr:hypothetical protein D9757_013922 [Collybiopsis confluens]